MESLVEFAVLGITTLVALFAALALQSMLLRVAFTLMQPATADRRSPRASVEEGARLVARAYAAELPK